VTYKLNGVFSAIADPNRRLMLDYLAMGDRTAGEIAERFAISRPAVAKHLRILETNNLIVIDDVGRKRVHRLNAAPLTEVRDWINSYGRFWDDRLASLKSLIENGTPGNKGTGHE
jgi:DNA-binding transcriptional ArsR family regulator